MFSPLIQFCRNYEEYHIHSAPLLALEIVRESTKPRSRGKKVLHLCKQDIFPDFF
jgi:hypothetical protein